MMQEQRVCCLMSEHPSPPAHCALEVYAEFRELYAAQDDAVSHIAKDVGLIKKRLDLVDAE
jgi:diadenosine tetraphosphate (Ap4A) HIT family hydrolase